MATIRNANQVSTSENGMISIVVPAFNEAEGLERFHDRLSAVLEEVPVRAEIVYVNDGSEDDTSGVIRRIGAQDRRVAFVDLSRNFGKEIALTAGLDHARGDAAIVIDADLQDPPELIPELLARWQDGYDVVYARRTARDGDSWLKKLTAFAFYRLMHRTADVSIPQDTGDFRLLSRRAIEAVVKLRERHRFMKGLFAWIGYRQVAVSYRREPRHAGKTKWNYWRLWNFAIEGITSFTAAPLKLASYLGLATAFAAFLYAAWIIYKTLMFGESVRGYPSLMVAVLFLGGVQLITIGILGEYIGRMFDETKNRPLYLVQEYHPADDVGSVG